MNWCKQENNSLLREDQSKICSFCYIGLKGGIVFYERRTQKVPCQDEQRSNMEVCFLRRSYRLCGHVGNCVTLLLFRRRVRLVTPCGFCGSHCRLCCAVLFLKTLNELFHLLTALLVDLVILPEYSFTTSISFILFIPFKSMYWWYFCIFIRF